MTGLTRFGQRTADGGVSFRCAACGEMAAVVRVVTAGSVVDMGPPLGNLTHERDGIVVDYFMGTAWKRAEAGTFTDVREILGGETPDPVALRRIDWELAPFYCPECGQNYCRADWHTAVQLDDGCYDCTMGTCPNGHEHMVDD